MRGRLAAVLVALLVPIAVLQFATAAVAAQIPLAQDDGVVGEEDEAENPGGAGEGEEGSEGQGDPDAESGAGEGETEEATEEEGPPWTYQMARIGVVLLVAMALGLWLLYHRLIGQRAKGAA